MIGLPVDIKTHSSGATQFHLACCKVSLLAASSLSNYQPGERHLKRMYAEFDRSSPQKIDTTVQCLSWKGTGQYGWLALGNTSNTVGVTFTSLGEGEGLEEASRGTETDSSNDPQPELTLARQGMRRNFNFREHSHEVREKGL